MKSLTSNHRTGSKGALDLILALALLLCGLAPVHAGEPDGDWVATWTASPQPTWSDDFVLPTGVPGVLTNRTIRQILRISLGGERVRIVISNAYGERPLEVGSAHVAVADSGAGIVPGTGRPITFNGRRRAVVPPGAPLVSDPIDLEVDSLATLAVSLYLPGKTPMTTFHWDARRTGYIAKGNRVDATRLKPHETVTARLFLSGVQIEAAEAAGAVAVIGDSITDGNGATMNAVTRWPDFLAQRLAAHDVAVINAGISGARLLADGMGVNALARFEHDVLSQPGIRAVIVLLGINDTSWPGTAFDPDGERPSLGALTAGYRQLIHRARLRDIRVVGATLPPFQDALPGTPLDDYYAPAKDKLRRRVNEWIRTSGAFDAVVDFDRLLRDPDAPSRLRPAFDSGDHLHPGDRGNEAMARGVDVEALLGTLKGSSGSE